MTFDVVSARSTASLSACMESTLSASSPGNQEKNNMARLKGDSLVFAGQDAISVKRSAAKSAQLSKEIRKVTAHTLRVRSVIAIPGWEIESQDSGEYLVVNERNIAMLTGWRDQKDYLLDEDVEAIHSDADRTLHPIRLRRSLSCDRVQLLACFTKLTEQPS